MKYNRSCSITRLTSSCAILWSEQIMLNDGGNFCCERRWKLRGMREAVISAFHSSPFRGSGYCSSTVIYSTLRHSWDSFQSAKKDYRARFTASITSKSKSSGPSAPARAPVSVRLIDVEQEGPLNFIRCKLSSPSLHPSPAPITPFHANLFGTRGN